MADWIELFRTMGGGIPGTPYDARWANIDLPRLHAWKLAEPYGEGTRVRFERNPYYFKVDSSGQQLPYIDEVVFDVLEDPQVLLLRASNGEIDMHARHITNDVNKPVLAENRENGGIEFFEVVPSSMNTTIFALNQTHKNETLRGIFQNLDFRVGLSHAINRQEIIDAVYVSQGEPWQLAPRQETVWYNETLAKQYTEFDVDLANEHLDKVLPDKDGSGMRTLPGGEAFSFVIDVAAEVGAQWIDVTNLVVGYWNAVGINVSLNSMDRSLMYTRKDANEHDCSVWGGDGGLNDAMLEARWYFPFSDESLYGIGWVVALGRAGGNPQAEAVEPPASIVEQDEMYRQIEETPDAAAQDELFNQLLAIAQENFNAIGISLPADGLRHQEGQPEERAGFHAGRLALPEPGAVQARDVLLRRRPATLVATGVHPRWRPDGGWLDRASWPSECGRHPPHTSLGHVDTGSEERMPERRRNARASDGLIDAGRRTLSNRRRDRRRPRWSGAASRTDDAVCRSLADVRYIRSPRAAT